MREVGARSLPLRIEYIHAPAGNVALARNACLDHAHAPLIASIDDDEIADAHWLARLHQGLQLLDVVFGPVQAQYAIDTPEWMRRGDFHSKVPVLRRDGRCDTGYTANVLLRRECIGARLGYCAVASLVCLWSPVHWRRQWLRGSLHLGVIATALGAVDVEIYGGSNASDV